MIGTWLLPTKDSSTISKYTYIFDIRWIDKSNFAWTYIFAPNNIYSTARFWGVSITVDCDPNQSS